MPKIAPEVLTASVWDAVKSVPGVSALYRGPLQAFGEKVKLERHGPVRLLEQEDPPVLEVHLVVAAGVPIPPLADEVHRQLRRLLASALGMEHVDVRVVIEDIAEPEATA
jgi:uncharacterized alkaline shock family protein YloU